MNLSDGEDLQQAVLSAPVGICILNAADFIAEIVNDKFVEVAGRPYEAISGYFYWDAFPETRNQYEPALTAVAKTGEPYNSDEVEVMLIRRGREEMVFVTFVFSPIKGKDGKVNKIAVWLLENAQQVKSRQAINQLSNELAEANQDLNTSNETLTHTQNDLKATVDALATSREQFSKMIQASPVALLVTRGDDMVFSEFNQAVLNMVGKDASIKGKPWFEAVPELKGQAVIDDLYHTYRTGEKLQLEEVPITMNRNGLPHQGFYSINYTPLIEGGKITGVLQSVVDVSEEVKSRREVEQLNEELRSANEGVTASNEELASTNEELSASQDELLRIHASLASSEQRFRTMIQEAPVAIFVLTARNMVFESVNKLMYQMLGKGPEIIGKPFAEAVPELIGQPFFGILDEVYSSGNAFQGNEVKGTFKVDGRLKDGYFNFIYQPLRNEQDEVYGIMCVAVDVLEQVEARNDLQKAYEQVRLSKEAAELGTFDMDLLAGTLIWDDRCRLLFGIHHDGEVTYERDFVGGLHPDDRDRIINIINDVFVKSKTNGIYDVEYRTIGQDDQRLRWVRAKGQVYFDQEDVPVRFIGSVLDITEQKHDEQRKNDFIGMVSHELKTPLTSLTAIVQMANLKLNKSDDQFIASAMEKANKQVKRMTSMINGFLNVSRLESAKLAIDKHEFDLSQLIQEIVNESRLTMTNHGINYAINCQVIVSADPDKIGSVITNLISNASKYSPNGTNIIVSCEVLDQRVQVTVSDQGIGLKPADQEKIFDRYFRVEENRTKNISGFGIGLYLSAEIIQRHQGAIWVESEIGKGSTFYFTLPL